MPSAGNQLVGVVKPVKLGHVMAEVVVQVGEFEIVSAMTRGSAESMGLKVGGQVKAIIKSTEVMVDKPQEGLMFTRSLLLMSLVTATASAADETKPIGPVEARKQVGKTITVKMVVKTVKDRLEKRGEIYLDAEEDFKDEKNFAVVITKKGAASLKEAGIDDPADHFKAKTITAKGTVKEVDGLPRIEIDEAKQIAVVKPGG